MLSGVALILSVDAGSLDCLVYLLFDLGNVELAHHEVQHLPACVVDRYDAFGCLEFLA
jgi:hypothetical protein